MRPVPCAMPSPGPARARRTQVSRRARRCCWASAAASPSATSPFIIRAIRRTWCCSRANTFDPLATLYERLAIPRDLRQTGSAAKGVDNLRSALDEGHAAIVEADAFGLPWTLLPPDERNWGMIPLLVYGLDEERAWIAGPSSQPLVIPAATLHEARGPASRRRSIA